MKSGGDNSGGGSNTKGAEQNVFGPFRDATEVKASVMFRAA